MSKTLRSPHDGEALAPMPRPCPICGKPASHAVRPFCSPRCADVDLHRWLSGTYAIPAAPDEAEEPREDQEHRA